MRFVLLVLLFVSSITSSLSASARTTRPVHRDDAAFKCYLIGKLPDSRLRVIAKDNHTTVRAIRHACWEVEHGGRSSSSDDGSSAPPAAADSCGGCGGGDLCMFVTGGWTCVFHGSAQNVCHTQGDCGNAICSDGMCH